MNVSNGSAAVASSTNCGYNLKKMGQLTNVGQVATIDNINKKIRQSLLTLSRKSLGLGSQMVTKEVTDLKVAYEITKQRNRRR